MESKPGRLPRRSLLDTLPPEWRDPLTACIQEAARNTAGKLIVLDDDPTGTQTVRDVPVLTRWNLPTLRAEFGNPLPCFYLLTNSRSLAADAARQLNLEIAANLRAAAGSPPQHFTLVSRSDSTLRGHFPVETDALAEVLGPYDATFLVPYFEAGGRYTVEDVHYVAEGDDLLPAAETPFAQDAAFGYRSSNLRQWVEEKTAGRIKAESVQSISLQTVRQGGPVAVAGAIHALPPGSICVVNACSPSDMEVFAMASLLAEQTGRRFLYRTAAQFVGARLGLAAAPPWRPPPTVAGPGGLIVVGSYVPKTTTQLKELLKVAELSRVELEVRALLGPQRQTLLDQGVAWLNRLLREGRDVVLLTSRELVTGSTATESLAMGRRISEALVEIVRRLETRPRYVVAKGGITSSDLATQGLDVVRALVLGQILPGVPVWELGPESRFPGLNYVVFPGNVGGPEALREVVTLMAGPSPAAA